MEATIEQKRTTQKRRRVSPQEFADMTGLSRPTVYRALRRGEIEGAIKIGAQWRIDPTPYL